MKGVKNEGKRKRKAPARKKKVAPVVDGPNSPTASVASKRSLKGKKNDAGFTLG